MIRLNDNAADWDNPARKPAGGEWQWAELVSEVCDCFERGAFADVTAAQAALDSARDFLLEEPLNDEEIAVCMRSRWPSASPAPVVFAYRSGRPLRTEILERRDALSATPGLQLAGFAVAATRADILPFVSIAVQRPAYIAGPHCGDGGGCGHRSLPKVRTAARAADPLTTARAALHDVAIAEFISAGELALTG
ncbi:MAG TPA: hypothetical protein VFW87_04255 [Pirellulales bacterium]|nr:hypothetical protein [Pirellulales bacterium]